ncbi:unnamed protein product [Lactuca saligna]|uniref:Formyl transferase N-terminal domain-containing protein n=1 Tax=Lactuca saligna TaxID=75948 RepID=A0AA35ZHN9_LACSI|nr:unnamed protein product [Lactuca saligna]
MLVPCDLIGRGHRFPNSFSFSPPSLLSLISTPTSYERKWRYATVAIQSVAGQPQFHNILRDCCWCSSTVVVGRSEFVFDPIKWQRKQMNEDFLDLSKMFNAVKSLVRVPSVDPKYKIALLASKQDHCLVDLLHAWQDGKLPVQISSVISNHDRVGNTHVMRFLERHEIPYHYLSKSKEKNVEDEILGLVEDTDFLVLSGNFLKRYGKDVINIHHGLLPSFKGGNPSRQAAGVNLIGAATHFVTEELDGGPIIEQMVERVSHKDNLLSFIQKSENLEKQCLMKAIKSY